MTVIGLVESIVFVNVWSRLFLVIIGTSDDMWRMTRLLTGDDDTQMTDGWQTLQNRQKLQLWNLTLSKMTAWPKKAQIIADFINCTIASSGVTMVIFQVQNHVVMLRYVIATRLDVAHTSMPSLSGIVVWPNIIMFFLLLRRFTSLDLNL